MQKPRGQILWKLLIVIILAALWFMRGRLLPEPPNPKNLHLRQEHAKIAKALNELEGLALIVRKSGRTAVANDDLADILRVEGNIRSIPNDPWGKPYQMDAMKRLLYSRGPDGIPLNLDDIKVRF